MADPPALGTLDDAGRLCCRQHAPSVAGGSATSLSHVRLLTPRVDVRQKIWLARRPYNVTSAGYDNYMKLYIS